MKRFPPLLIGSAGPHGNASRGVPSGVDGTGKKPTGFLHQNTRRIDGIVSMGHFNRAQKVAGPSRERILGCYQGLGNVLSASNPAM